MKNYKFSVLIEKDEDGMLIAKVPDLPGCHTQAKTMPQLLKRIQEAVELCLEENKAEKRFIVPSEFIGIQQIDARI
ncbi:MAG TPA: type II toxin-antitoxin system HicB family antitoxin [Elusimicrobiales bacterium]|nr:type II toxin-antitoxin system HicB family antitoxin [Elusimicrobiales bacterium]